jgi:acyl-CoA dehydrogenase
MDLAISARTRDLLARLNAFMDEHIYPNELLYHRQVAEGDRWAHVELLDKLAIAAKAAGLWNLFWPRSDHGAGLSNVEYAPLCEVMGRVHWSSQVA